MESFKEDFALLFEGGMLAMKQGDEEGARKIFDALGVLDSEHYAKELGQALIALHKMQLKEAAERLSALHEREGDNWSIKAFLSLTHMLIVLDQGSTFEVRRESLENSFRLAEKILAECEIATTKAFARSIMDWHEALAKKSAGPLR
ncbi:hypothetical protein [Chlamydiifrater volucris]|uniref:hypothetical protein n=1 Tax=Chlamydiifrater volucris TaxID=2681470 RepID=UPI001BCA9131|nr:hypothetical protein [Chlamydiifrater volucris]